MYRKILNPESGRMVSVNGKIGRKVLNNYINMLGGAQAQSMLSPGDPIESFEQLVNKVLNTARDHAGKSAQSSLDETNSVKAMVSAGSKGSFINISQIIQIISVQNFSSIPSIFLNPQI